MAVIAALVIGGVSAVLLFKAVKKKTAASVRILFALLLCAAILIGFFGTKKLTRASAVAGVYSGTEYDKLEVKGVRYEACYDAPYNSRDKDELLGKAVWINEPDGAHHDPMYIWTVKGSDEYLYALWVYDGTFFKRVQ